MDLRNVVLAADPRGADFVTLRAGEVLFREGDIGDSLFLVEEGRLEAFVTMRSVETFIGTIGPGQLVGEMQVFGGGRRTASVRAPVATRLLSVPRDVFDAVCRVRPDVQTQLLRLVTERVRRIQLATAIRSLFGAVDDALLVEMAQSCDWLTLARGDVLIRQGEPSLDIYFVVSGRLRVSARSRGGDRVDREIGRGETVGEMGMFLGRERTASVVGVRRTTLARLSNASFEKLAQSHPDLLKGVLRILSRRLEGIPDGHRRFRKRCLVLRLADGCETFPELPQRVASAVENVASTVMITRAVALDALGELPGKSEFTGLDSMLATAWLEEVCSRYDCVLMVADNSEPAWDAFCREQADAEVAINEALADPTCLSSMTADGLTTHHVWVHPTSQARPAKGIWRLVHSPSIHIRHLNPVDEARLARELTELSVGLVLSGGGAAGFAHIGVLRALSEVGIPVDVVGGTSIGSVIAAQHAMGYTWRELVELNRRLWVESRPSWDLTVPLLSLLSCGRFDRVNRECFGDLHIEDLWVPFFCVATDISSGESVVRDSGPVWRAIRASCALPGITPPILESGHVFVDGGVTDNLPVAAMRLRCGGPVIAVDVTNAGDFEFDAHEMPSPWEYLRRRVGLSSRTERAPHIVETLLRSFLVGGIASANRGRRMADLALSPPVGSIGLLDFGALDRLVEIGYLHAMERLPVWWASVRAPVGP